MTNVLVFILLQNTQAPEQCCYWEFSERYIEQKKARTVNKIIVIYVKGNDFQKLKNLQRSDLQKIVLLLKGFQDLTRSAVLRSIYPLVSTSTR